MNLLSPLIETLGWTFLHFLWQGTAVAGVLWIVLHATMRHALPQTRYAAAGVALALMLATTAVTLWRQGTDSFSATAWQAAEGVTTVAPSAPRSAEASLAVSIPAESAAGAIEARQGLSQTPPAGANMQRRAASEAILPRMFPWLVGLWAAGSGLLSLRVLNSWRMARRLRHAAEVPQDTSWNVRFGKIRERLRVSNSVRLLSTAGASVPMVIGWLKPAVLVPAALFAGLPPAHLEAILAHELAHVRRHDYLVNLLQTMVETLLFYHPAVWWVSAQLRNEREHCCDDVASAACSSPTDYARALAALEEIRGSALVLGMAATGGSLLGRIRRLAGVRDDHAPAGASAWPLGLFALVALVAALPLTLQGVAGQPASSVRQAQPSTATVTVTNEPGSWDLGGGVTLEIKEDIWELDDGFGKPWRYKTPGSSRLVLRWAATEHRPALVYGMRMAQVFSWTDFGGVTEVDQDLATRRVFPVHEPWAIAWEKDRRVLWIAAGELPRDAAKQAKPKARMLKILDFSDPAAISQQWLSGAPATDPGGAQAVEPLRGLIEIDPHGLEHSRHVQWAIQDTPGADPFPSIIITARSDGGYNIGETRCQAADLVAMLNKMAGTRTNRSVMIGGASEVPYAAVTAAIAACQEAGIGFWSGSSAPTPVLQFRLVADTAAPDTEPLPVTKRGKDQPSVLDLQKSVILSTADARSATAKHNVDTGFWDIDLRLTDAGRESLAKASKANIGRQLAIVVNGEVVAAPTIQSEIGRDVMISGRFSEAEANELVGRMQAVVKSRLRVIIVSDENRILLDGSPVTLDELEQRLRQYKSTNPEVSVTVRSDDRTQYQRVVEVVDRVAKVGITQVGLSTKPADQETPREETVQPDNRAAKLSPAAPVLQFRLVADAAGPDTERMPVPKPGKDRPSVLDLQKPVIVSAADVISATAKHDQTVESWHIYLRLTDAGGESLSKASKANLGRQLAIVVNGEVVSAPTIHSEIGREVMISGHFSEAEAKHLAGAINPQESKATPTTPEKILIAIERSGTVTLNGEVTEPSKLRAKLESLAKSIRSPIVLRAHSETRYQDVVKVVEICRDAGLAVRLTTDTERGTEPVNPQSPPPAVSPDSGKPTEAPKTGISLVVVDSATQKPVPNFQVVAGVKSRVSEGKEVVNWQPHTLRTGQNGALTWPLAKAYDPMALRIEADGYAPQVSAWIKKSEGAKHVAFQLVPDAGTSGRVLLPDGPPAAGATVALAMVQRDAVIEGGKLRHLGEALPDKPADRWRWPVFVTADADGRFQLPAETDPTAAVLLMHAGGVRELALADFKKSPEVTLHSWGRLEGRVLWGDKAGGDQPVSLSIHRDTYGYPGVIAQYGKTTAAADGGFVFERVLPGPVQVSCPIVAGTNKSGITEINLPGRTTHVTLQPGVTPMLVGGQGRSVKGRVTGRDSWEGVTFHFHPTAPHVGFPGDDAMWKAWGEFKRSPSGPLFFREGLKVNADGTFEIPNALPGDYQIFFSREGEKGYIGSGKFGIGTETPGQKPEAQDMGEFKAGPAGN